MLEPVAPAPTPSATGSLQAEIGAVARLAAPLALANLGQIALGAVDLAVVGRLGQTAMAATGLGGTLFFSASVVGVGAVLGIDALVAQAQGAREPRVARRWLWQGAWLGALLAAPLIGVGLGLGASLEAFGIAPDVAAETRHYLAARLPSVLPYLVFIACRSYLQAHARTRPIVLGVVLANLLNLPLATLLVFGDRALPGSGLPALGAAGAALSNTIVTLLQLLIALIAVRGLAPSEAREALPPGSLAAPSRALIARAARLGAPVGLTMLAEHGVFALATLLAGRLGTAQLAAHHVALTLAATSFMVPLGIGAAASVRVGTAVGAQDRAGARRAGVAALLLGALWAVTAGAAMVLAPTELARALSPEPSTIAAAVPLLVVAAVFQLSDGAQAILAGALRGAGDTRWPLVANLAGHWSIGLPVSLFAGFTLGLGAVGLWWGLSAGLVAVAIALGARFQVLSSREIARS